MIKSHEREITEPVDLSLPNGRVNPDALGWTRRSLHRANLKGWGRNKRFEYWCITSRDFVISANVSHHDYRVSVGSAFVDLNTGESVDERTSAWMPRGLLLPEVAGGGRTEGRAGRSHVLVEPTAAGTRIRSNSPRLSVDLLVEEDPGHERMGVVVPWSERTYQYTQKNNWLPVHGFVKVDGVERRLGPDALAIHDHGRGRWPYHTRWNWAAGHGEVKGQRIGLQFGGKWTVDTPATENCLRIDGRLHKIHDELRWEYDPQNFLTPWRISGDRVDVTFTPIHHQHHLFNRMIISARGDQCFGTFAGEIVDDEGTVIHVQDIFGLAEEVERRW